MTLRLDLARWAIAAGFAGLAALLGVLAGYEPALAIGACLAIAFLMLSFVDLSAGLVAFTLIVFLEFVVPGGPLLSLTKGAGLILSLAWLGRITVTEDRRTYFAAHPVGTYLLLAFLAWGTLSVTWSEDASASLTELSRYLLVFALFVIVYTAVDRRRAVWWVFGAFIFGTALTAIYGMVSTPTADPEELLRSGSSVGNVNVLAAILVAGLVVSLGAAFALRRSPGLRALTLGVAAICLFSFVFTGSRSGVVSLAAVLVAAVIVAGRWRPQVLAGVVALTVTTVAMFGAFAPDSVRERIAQTTPGEVAPSEGRLTLWEVAWRMVEQEPVRGVGVGGFQAASIHYVLEPGALTRTDQVIDEPEVAHNVYLQTLAETGIVGELLLVGVLGFPLGCALAAARNFARLGDREFEVLARSLAVAVVAILVSNFFASEQFNKLLWLLLGLGPALLAISQGPGSAGEQPATRRS